MSKLAEKYNKLQEYLEQIYIRNKHIINNYYILSLSYFISCIWFYFLIHVNSSKNDINFLNEIINDFNKPLMTSIQVKNYNYIYGNAEFITFGTWHGTKEGCYCKEDSQILNEKCDVNQISKNCFNIKPIYPKTFLKYRGNYFIKNMYGLTTTTYRDILKDNSSYIIVGNEENCPEDYELSGIFDSFKNKLCRHFGSDYPINGIIISNQKEIKNYSLAFNYEPLDENKYLHYTKYNTNGDIISDLFIFKEQPCYYSQEYNWDTFSELEEGKGAGCKANDGAKDDRYKFIDSYNQSSFYSNNDILNYPYLKYMKNEDKQKLNNSLVKLYYRNFIGFNHSCLKRKNIYDIYQEFIELQYTAEELRLFYSRLSYDIEHFIINPFGKFSLIKELLLIFFVFVFKIDNPCKIANILSLIIYLNIPEIFVYCNFIYNSLKIKKMNRSIPEIIDNMYECCDEYTKYGLDLLWEKYDVKYYFNFHTYNKYFLFTSIVIIVIYLIFILIFIFLIIKIIKIKCDIYSRTKNHSSLIEESNNKDNTNDNQQEVNNNEITNRRYENI